MPPLDVDKEVRLHVVMRKGRWYWAGGETPLQRSAEMDHFCSPDMTQIKNTM